MAHHCPRCRVDLVVTGWHMPGMRCLATLECERCRSRFFGDLPSGQGLYTPMLLEPGTGVVHDEFGVEWFARWLGESFASRTSDPPRFTVREGTTAADGPRRAVLLNCLDRIYGHSLLKLLNAQSYRDTRPDLAILVLAPERLAWLIPDWVHEAWLVDLPFSSGAEWNDGLAEEIRRRVERFEECLLSLAFSHPSSADFAIEEFSRTAPFPLAEWEQRLERPVVTFVWRDDRLWSGAAGWPRRPPGVERQTQHVVALGDELRRELPALDFAIAGLGEPGAVPSWVTDLRAPVVDDATERRWCERYAESHVVAGVHGSNMLLPSAHAGATVELMPSDRWGNYLQDLIVPTVDEDPRAAMFLRRALPHGTPPAELAQVIASILRLHGGMRLMLTRDASRHGQMDDTSPWLAPRRTEA